MRLSPASSWRLSRKPAATSMARWPRRSGMSGRVRWSWEGQSRSVTAVLAQSPERLASSAAATGSTVRVAKSTSPAGVAEAR